MRSGRWEQEEAKALMLRCRGGGAHTKRSRGAGGEGVAGMQHGKEGEVRPLCKIACSDV